MHIRPLIVATLALVSVGAVAGAQEPAAPAAAPLPMAPAGIAYRYWPVQLVQWVGPELPYSMIDLDVDDRGAKPIYDAVLTDRKSGKRVHYVNQPSELAIDKAVGAEVYMVPMQFDQPAEATNGSTYLLRFVTETGTPVTWQFVQGSDVTEQGSGLTAMEAPTPALLYREQGAVAGEGTALKVGNVTSAAEMWKEISQPPYFVAYRGALSHDVHLLAFVPRRVEWKIDPASAAVTPGADWKLTSSTGAGMSAHVISLANGAAVVSETNAMLGTSVTLECTQTPHGWSLTRARYAPSGGKAGKGEHAITVTFSPAISEAGSAKFDVVAGRKTHLASGSVITTAGGKESWSITEPAWSKLAPVEASAVASR